MIAPVAWHHIWAGDRYHGSNWRPVVREYFELLSQAGFKGEVNTGIVGAQEQRQAVVQCVDNWWNRNWHVRAVADEGFEMVTLHAMHEWAQTADPGTPVLYTHSKGAFQAYPGNHAWRRAMESALVGSWQERVAELAEGYDAVGMHWLTHREWPDLIIADCVGIFGGNFWWATAGYIAKLPPIGWNSRYCAEGWIGKGYPNVKNLKKGWPMYTGEGLSALG